MSKKFSISFFLASFAAAFASLCPSQMIAGEGRGGSKEAADRAADLAIARSISSSISSVSRDTLSSKVIDGVLEDYSSFSETAKMESFLRNRQSVKQLKPHYKENGEFVSERYICVKDAALPYLNQLKDLARALKAQIQKTGKSQCKSIDETYRKIEGLETVLSNLAQMSGEVQAEYEKLKKEYQRIKIFWQDDGNECSETVFAIFSKKIKMERAICSGGLNLRFSCQEKCKSSSLGMECSCSPSLAVETCEGEKYLMLKAKEPVIGSDAYNKNMAKENLIENLPKVAFFKEWEKEIMKWVPQCAE
jgi:hypothetical protein